MAEPRRKSFGGRRAIWHVLFWIFLYLFYTITYGGYYGMYKEEALSNLYLLPVRIGGVYAFIYYILPFLLNKRRPFVFALLVAAHAALWGMALWLVLYYFYYCSTCVNPIELNFFHWPKITSILMSNYVIPSVATAIVLVKKSFRDQAQKQELEKGKIEAELKFLKSQIHPHFLFNTLNNLYALTLKKSAKAPGMVLRLSEMLDYMLYSNDTEVKLEQEIDHLNAYLELEKLRYGDRLNLSMNVRGDVKGRYVAPLILLPFVENSFKHGASADVDHSYIAVNLNIQDSGLEFSVVNSYKDQKADEDFVAGIGLKNVQRRLELIYPQRHILIIEKEKLVFKARLYIKWAEQEGTNAKKVLKYEDQVLNR